MKNASLIAAAAMLCLSGPVLAADASQAPWSATSVYDGAKLFVTHASPDGLTEDQKAQVAFAYGWLVGAENALEASGIEGRSGGMICVPLPPSPADLANQYVSYVEANPVAKSADAVYVLMTALRQRYPCK